MHTLLDMGTILAGRYRLVSGGQDQDIGTVYQATDLGDGHAVSVLVLPGGWLPGSQTLSRIQGVQQTVAALGQPGLLPYEHAGLIGGQVYLVRRLVGGASLAQVLAHSAVLEPGLAVDIALSLCETLAPLHAAGLVHGGLSPHSLFLHESGPETGTARTIVTVVDVGLLPALPPGFVAGRGPYFAPEQAWDQTLRPAADVYVVAALLYAMLAGRPPFRAHDPAVLAVQHQRQMPPSLDILCPGLPAGLGEVVGRALAKDPAARFRDARQLGVAIRAARPSVPAPPRTPAPAPGRLIVPPPPDPEERPGRPARLSYLVHDEDGAGRAQRDDGNLLTVVLLILALIAVLGLIPLWRTVHRRWALPLPTAAPASESWLAPPSAGRDLARTSDPEALRTAGNWSLDGFFDIIKRSALSQSPARQGRLSLVWSQDYGHSSSVVLSCRVEKPSPAGGQEAEKCAFWPGKRSRELVEA